VCQRLQEEGIHCAIDTAGAVPWAEIEAVLPHTDLFLFDLKLVDDRAHREHAGVPNTLILENLRRLSSCGTSIEVRMPLIPGTNDAEGDLQAVAECLIDLPGANTLRLLPYHTLARSKYDAIGRLDTMPDVPTPDDVALGRAEGILRQAGLSTVVWGY
jgi:pyruvate-formate lyase-activating enzyme